ncbi:MAG: ABC transporter permease [candidate division Zixibacteria bacterium]|nr:ABC transporter permease [candidate division Zixibacteria bacterium]NIR66114.1 ABC transporter permease [candidate division Zixibacteria bacterium]NIS17432.1 ABC transporter permease [candidate division Zixibacteria bacterium]NIS47735.1 ABC transporter permease [candidate division Zixibacteria bacterium]NIT53760.1 ABC transporter permease [candidate division Zixibacteria bacterium]
MMFKIALRNIFRRKRRSIITMLTMFVGFVLAAISIGWSDGTYNNIIDSFTRNRLGHIQIHGQDYLDKPSLYNNIENYDSLQNIIAGIDGVEFTTPRLSASGLASLNDKSAGVRIIGVDPEIESKATHLDRKVTEGKYFSSQPSNQTLLGEWLAKILKASIGDTIVIISQAADGSIANDLYRVAGIIESGDKMADRTSFYLHLEDAQELLVLQNRIHEIAVICDNLDDVPGIATNIRAAINDSELDVATWKEFAKSFYRAMRADKEGMWIMLVVILIMVAVGVLNTVLMSVLERTHEYGVLRALGTAPGQVFRLVIIEVLIIAVAGIIVGCGLSYLINDALSAHGVPLPEAFTYGGVEFKRMYTEVNLRSFYIPALSVVLSAFLVSIFPAVKAARIPPAQAMRTV